MNTQYDTNLICPHCQHIHTEWYEYIDDDDESIEDFECQSCDAKFDVTVHRSIKFSTTCKVHELEYARTFGDESLSYDCRVCGDTLYSFDERLSDHKILKDK